MYYTCNNSFLKKKNLIYLILILVYFISLFSIETFNFFIEVYACACLKINFRMIRIMFVSKMYYFAYFFSLLSHS